MTVEPYTVAYREKDDEGTFGGCISGRFDMQGLEKKAREIRQEHPELDLVISARLAPWAKILKKEDREVIAL